MEIQIRFRAFRLADADFVNALRSNEKFENKIGGNKRFVSLERDQKWIEDIISNDHQDKIFVAIYKKNDSEQNIIGYASIINIDHVNKSCEWGGIKLDEKFNGKGLGTQAALTLLKYVFEELNMERYAARCLENHSVSLKMMKKVGFKVEGALRHSIFKNGNYQNQFLLSILKLEYKEIKTSFNL